MWASWAAAPLPITNAPLALTKALVVTRITSACVSRNMSPLASFTGLFLLEADESAPNPPVDCNMLFYIEKVHTNKLLTGESFVQIHDSKSSGTLNLHAASSNLLDLTATQFILD